MTQDVLTMPQQHLPEGQFLLPLCVNKQQVQDILDAMLYARGIFPQSDGDFDYMNPVLEGLAFVETPGNAPCVAATPEDGFCTDYSTASSMITFAPQDPRINPEFVPEGYNVPPFYFQPGTTRIVTSLERIPNLLDGVPDVGFPRFRLSFVGEGVVELHLVSVVQGGLALITLDDNPLSTLVMDTNRDLTSIPPETSDQLTCEVVVSGSGAHHIDCTFVPQFNDEAIPIRFGGGIEKFVLCGEDIHGDGTMPEFQFRRKPATNNYTLQVKIGGGDWLDTEYSFVGSPIIETSISTDVKDENGDTIGTFTKLPGANPPGTQVIVDNYSLELSRAAFQGGDGEPGLDGKSIEFDSTPSVPVDPNQPPEIVVTGNTDTVQTVQAKLPRAPTFTVGDVVPIAPDGVPTFDLNDTETGDYIVDVGLVTGAQGLQGLPGSGFSLDDTEPEDGLERIYSLLVMADGTLLPIKLKAGDILTVPGQAHGLWIVDNLGTPEFWATDENGLTIGLVDGVGSLVVGVMEPGDTAFVENTYTTPITATQNDTVIRFSQAFRAGFGGQGYLSLDVSVFRPGLPEGDILGVFDFRTGRHGYASVEAAGVIQGVYYGGYYVASGSILTQGFYANAGGFGLNQNDIVSPLVSTPVEVSAVTVWHDFHDGNGAKTILNYHNGSGWHDFGNLEVMNAGGGSTTYTFSPVTLDQLAIISTNYGQSDTNWRIWKLSVS